MSEVKLVIRDAIEDRSGTVDGAVADWFIAALSADPVSIVELDAAVDRFALESPERGHLSRFSRFVDAEPWDAGLIVIDLAARLVAINSSYSKSGPQGEFQRYNVEGVEGGTIFFSYQLSDDWLFVYESSWEEAALVRRRERNDQPDVDLRKIFYGEPMLRFIINGCWQQLGRREEITDRVHREWIERSRLRSERYGDGSEPDPSTLTMHELAGVEDPAADIDGHIFYDTIRDIHADWLMTPCEELNGQLPRTVLLRDHDRLSRDMSDREHQWSMLGECPPGISPEFHAFRFGGFNTNEIVMYYDYVREVAWSCWDALRTLSHVRRAEMESSQQKLKAWIGDEVVRLQKVGEQWLDAPWDEDPMRTPRGIISRERTRLPDGGQFHPIDPDCPCCQALAELPGIGFWHMDGCNMDDLFAFAYFHRTVESWEQEQAEYRELSRQMDQEHELAREWGLPSLYGHPTPDFAEVWHLAVKRNDGEIPLGRRLNSVAHGAISVIVRLRIAAEHDQGLAIQGYVDRLQFGYAQLQQACEASTRLQLSTDVEQAVGRLLEVLNLLAADLNRYLPESLGEEFAGDIVASQSDRRSSHAGYWGRVSHDLQELRHTLKFFANVPDEHLYDHWSPDDPPF